VRRAALILVGGALLVGCGADGESSTIPARTEARVTATPVPEPPAPATPTGMDQASFWAVIAGAREAAGGDTERKSELLEERLRQLPAQQIADFGRRWHRLDQRAYTWDIWGAAYVIDDGCSDDCFRDFRAYLISLGRQPYEAALRDPDALAPVVQDAETGDWENADNVAPDAYEEVAGEDIPSGDSDVTGAPTGEPWDDEQQDELVRRFPRLAARFR
jgi:Protein of unknown function (DUF4240)